MWHPPGTAVTVTSPPRLQAGVTHYVASSTYRGHAHLPPPLQAGVTHYVASSTYRSHGHLCSGSQVQLINLAVQGTTAVFAEKCRVQKVYTDIR